MLKLSIDHLRVMCLMTSKMLVFLYLTRGGKRKRVARCLGVYHPSFKEEPDTLNNLQYFLSSAF